MSISSQKELEALRKVGGIVASCLRYMQSKLEPGITTLELDGMGGKFLELHGAGSAPQNEFYWLIIPSCSMIVIRTFFNKLDLKIEG